VNDEVAGKSGKKKLRFFLQTAVGAAKQSLDKGGEKAAKLTPYVGQ
jgi:hypothetical protein